MTDPLDAVGNTTKAVTKGLCAIWLGRPGGAGAVRRLHPHAGPATRGLQICASTCPITAVIIGLFIGGLVPTCSVHGDEASAARLAASSTRCVVSSKRCRASWITPEAGLLARRRHADQGGHQGDDHPVTAAGAAVPVVGRPAAPAKALGGLLISTIVNGLFVAISMTTGGAPGTMPKYIEDGSFGGEGSGCPRRRHRRYRRSLQRTPPDHVNPLIKIINIVAHC